MKKIIILAFITLFMVGCASTSGSNTKLAKADVSDGSKLALADKDSEEKVICTQERRIGSNRITTICRSESELKYQREQTQNALRNNPRVGGGVSGGAAAGDR